MDIELSKVIDGTLAALMLEEVNDGYSLSKATLYITTREYRREDFAAFRQAHGDAVTIGRLTELAGRASAPAATATVKG